MRICNVLLNFFVSVYKLTHKYATIMQTLIVTSIYECYFLYRERKSGAGKCKRERKREIVNMEKGGWVKGFYISMII